MMTDRRKKPEALRTVTAESQGISSGHTEGMAGRASRVAMLTKALQSNSRKSVRETEAAVVTTRETKAGEIVAVALKRQGG